MSRSREQRDYINPGPYVGDLLRLQDTHISTKVWWSDQEHNDEYYLECKRGGGLFSTTDDDPMDAQIIENLSETGFIGMTKLKSFQIDWHLITALVERWRPETHTFHFPDGECTVTLQDVEILTGLPIDGNALVGQGNHNWRDLCESLLGVRPPPEALRGCMLNIKWLKENFQSIPANAPDEILNFYTRATMLLIIVDIFCDKSKGRVSLQYLPFLSNIGEIRNYSWGGACLAFLYRELCDATKIDNKSISGPLFLLQMWAWERIRCVSPRLSSDVLQANEPYGARWRASKKVFHVDTHVIKTIRYRFDRMDSNGFKWQPYTDEIIEALPEYCKAGRDIWIARVPLICICIVEWHLPDRVLRQFGFDQPIPVSPTPSPMECDLLHACDLRKTGVNWLIQHAVWIEKWNRRRTHTIDNSVPICESLPFHAQYMEWYRRVTRRWMTFQGATHGVMGDGLERLSLMPDRNTPEANSILESLISVGAQERRVTNMIPPHQAPQTTPIEENDEENNIGTSNTHRRRRRVVQQRTQYQTPETIPGLVVPEPVAYHYSYNQGESSSSQPCQFRPTFDPSCMPYASHYGTVQALRTQSFFRPQMYSQTLESPWQVNTPPNTVYGTQFTPLGQGSLPTQYQGGSSHIPGTSTYEEIQLNDENVSTHETPLRVRREHRSPIRFTPSDYP